MKRTGKKRGVLVHAVSVFGGLIFPISAANAQHGVHPAMPNQQPRLYCRINGEIVEAKIAVQSATTATQLNQVVGLPDPFQPIHITNYYPSARLERTVVADENGQSAVELSIDGPTQSHQWWMVADDAEHNRLTSYIGSWRYMAVADDSARDELKQQFDTELTREPRLFVRIGDEPWVMIPATPNTSGKLAGGPEVRVLKFLPDFALDKATKEPFSQSTRRANPAALVSISQNGQTEQRWVFAKFPDFNKPTNDKQRVSIRLDCPIDTQRVTPDFLIVTTGKSHHAPGKVKHEVWIRHKDKQIISPFSLGDKIEVLGSQYTFSMLKFVPHGHLEEIVRSDPGGKSASILQISIDPSGAGAESVALEAEKEKAIPTANGVINLLYTLGGTYSTGGHP